MRRMRYMWGGVVLISLLAMGCQSKPDENQQLIAQNQELQRQLTALKNQPSATPPEDASLAALRQQLAAANQEIAKLKEDATARPTTPAPGTPGLDGVETTYDPNAGTVTATLSGDVLFDAGQATLRPAIHKTLDKIVEAIQKQYPNHRLYIDGHTDIDPINRSSDKWGDNFDLSYFRAKAVADYLKDKGIDDKWVTIRAYGPNDPKKTKALSRRVEIVVKVK